MQRIEVNGLVYEFEDDMSLMLLLDENANRVYEGIVTEEAPPNAPLTLEELREMDGEPVWIQHLGENKGSRWRIIKYSSDASLHVEDSYPALYYGLDTYGFLWNAYRRKPEEG